MQGLKYIVPPASFERSGQKVRSPGHILDRKLATCLDLTLLYAACLEQAGLNPVVVLTEGHAFLGLWLTDERAPHQGRHGVSFPYQAEYHLAYLYLKPAAARPKSAATSGRAYPL